MKYKSLALLAFLMPVLPLLGAQNGQESRLDLSIAISPDAVSYEIQVEREEGRNNQGDAIYTLIISYQKEIKESNLKVRLRPGTYRYRVIVYYKVKTPGDPTNWQYFSVEPGPLPNTKSEVRREEVKNTPAITLIIENSSQVEERPIEELDNTDQALSKKPVDNTDQAPATVSQTTKTDPEKALKKQSVGFQLEADYSPLFPLYGKLNTYLDAIYPFGMDIRMAILVHGDALSLGVEAAGSLRSFTIPPIKQLKSGGLYTVGLNFLFQIRIAKPLLLNIRIGAGSAIFDRLQFETATQFKSGTYVCPYFASGISLNIFFGSWFFIAPGVEFMNIFTVDQPSPAYIKTSFGIGFRL
ncbi:MAG: hypothetical protein LBV68_00555 [Spirochaetaceae bacterium]|jgi:hypothetical protein|nr:hypothetical protein [Spirochaetaceae bacterium]